MASSRRGEAHASTAARHRCLANSWKGCRVALVEVPLRLVKDLGDLPCDARDIVLDDRLDDRRVDIESTAHMPRECRGGGRCRPSQDSSSRENVVAEAFTKTGVGDNVDVAPQRVAEIHQQAAKIQQATPLVETDKEVDVARGRCVSTQNRSENPNVRGTMTSSDTEDLLTTTSQIRERDGT